MQTFGIYIYIYAFDNATNIQTDSYFTRKWRKRVKCILNLSYLRSRQEEYDNLRKVHKFQPFYNCLLYVRLLLCQKAYLNYTKE